ncbi:hypothetical protein HUT18_11520 [Streptomyces sp. NA04227]|uniref:2'-5' RNA ligase family protein n=1 Tax=Streptomyces sp. NA04227 TaxID=2742136 RepID=UPI0015907513|nr:2'-5' RNA ligase family protein [Streptomyces sp. NA04227]QKW06928.1 hypothetical protein HUT18_11520 [Streptomyces sp. NA04227]
MQPFKFQHGTDAWKADSVLHVYGIVDLVDPRHEPLITLLTKATEVLLDAGFPVCPVEPQWLHITLDQLSGRPASAVPQEEREALVEALNRRLSDVAPLDVVVGSMLAYHSGVIGDLHPDEEIAALHTAVRSTIRSVCGEAATRYLWGVQHLTAAYAYDHADSDAAQRLLRRVRPSHAHLHISAVHLVDVTATTTEQSKTITWEHLAEIPLGG